MSRVNILLEYFKILLDILVDKFIDSVKFRMKK